MGAAGGTRTYRIGEVAKSLGVTTRTLRYYEELGLLESLDRRKGGHRQRGHRQAAAGAQATRLLGLSLEASLALAQAEGVCAGLRDSWENEPSDGDRLLLLDRAHPLIVRQLELVHGRQVTLSAFARELRKTLRTVEHHRAALEAARGPRSGLTSAG